jgi:hypothetical protein
MASLLDLAQARLGGLLAPQRPSMAGLLGGQRTQGNLASALQGYTPPQMTAMTNPQVMDYARNVAQTAQQNLQTQMSDLDKALVMDQGGINVGDRQALARLMEQVPGLMGATAYHASPYKFNKFDPSKVGTGEGAQSYGVGAGYVAENPKVANEYFKAFTDVESIPLMYKGKKVDTPWNDEISQRWADVIEKNKFTQEQVEDFQGVLGNLSQVNTMQDVPNVLRGLSKDQLKIYDKYIKSELTKPEIPEAFMYKLDVADEAIPKMLDWDKPLADQTKEVQEALKKLGISTDKQKLSEFDDALLKALNTNEKVTLPEQPINPTGSEIYQRLVSGSPETTSAKLKEVGITGIKYLDAFSRRDTPKPTYNFVPFDPEDMKILETTKGLLE